MAMVNEERIKSITSIYYSKPQVQQALLEFSNSREVIPRYVEAFGKRPDTIQYPKDILSLVQKGATSFHSSEELWRDPLQIQTEMDSSEMNELRTGWDLLIDIDSPYLDYSKIAAELILDFLEKYGIVNYGIKFSGGKGFHIIVPWKAFPEIFNGHETKMMFPEWPRIICQFILNAVKPIYNSRVKNLGINFKAIEDRLKVKKEDLISTAPCPNCGSNVRKSIIIYMKCPKCNREYIKKDFKPTARKLKCNNEICSGFFDIIRQEDYFVCDSCKTSSLDNRSMAPGSRGIITVLHKAPNNFSSEVSKEDAQIDKLGSLDLVLVSPRHLFRMPYSLHEKTALASIVLDKESLARFSPRDADPLTVRIMPFIKKPKLNEAEKLLSSALQWASQTQVSKEKQFKKSAEEFQDIKIEGVTEDMFPKSIKTLLKGLKDGRKRGLFVLITFLKSLNFPTEYVNLKVREWNQKNDPPLKEGYVRSQLDWHSKQKRKILPPNYSNDSFYKDLKLLDYEPNTKNPLVEVLRIARRRLSR